MRTSSDTLVLLEDKCALPLKLLLTALVTCRLLPCRDIHDRDGDDCDEDGDVDYYVGDDCDDDDDCNDGDGDGDDDDCDLSPTSLQGHP